ncbi:hypothetical protein [Deinococcus sp. ME38]|uniref:hypothetical protein n=1 Tax=Deinococcus sp. ME38 TaxID=3400344 RepID=UPI003B5C5C08
MRSAIFLAILLPALVSMTLFWASNSLLLDKVNDNLSTSQARDCALPVKLKLAFPYQSSSLKIINFSEPYAFMVNGWLSADICEKGTLIITGQGQIADGVAPVLQIALDSRLIWKGAFRQVSTVMIPIKSKGHLTIGYFNDFYSSDYRSAFMEGVRLQSEECQSFTVDTPVGTDGSWNVEKRTLGWLSPTPITLHPCGDGKLMFSISGREGGKDFATIDISQGGKSLRKIRLSQQPQEVVISITAQPLKIRIVNPYFKELGDRNLILRKVQFIPER